MSSRQAHGHQTLFPAHAGHRGFQRAGPFGRQAKHHQCRDRAGSGRVGLDVGGQAGQSKTRRDGIRRHQSTATPSTRISISIVPYNAQVNLRPGAARQIQCRQPAWRGRSQLPGNPDCGLCQPDAGPQPGDPDDGLCRLRQRHNANRRLCRHQHLRRPAGLWQRLLQAVDGERGAAAVAGQDHAEGPDQRASGPAATPRSCWG